MKIRVIFLTILLIAFKSSAYSSNNSPFKNLVILTDPKEYKEIIFKDINGKNLSLNDFVYVQENELDKDFCQHIIDKFEITNNKKYKCIKFLCDIQHKYINAYNKSFYYEYVFLNLYNILFNT